MAKRRTPETAEDALDQAIGFVGIDRVAGIVGKSANVVRKLGDPDKDHHLQLRQALAIDRDLALNGYPQPFAELVAALAARNGLAERQLAHALVEQRPLHEAAEAVCQASRLVADIEKAEADKVYSPEEVARLRKAIRALQKRLPAIEAAVLARSAAGMRDGGRSRR